MPKPSSVDRALFEGEYHRRRPDADSFRLAMVDEISSLVDNCGFTLATPMESRVKSLASILAKAERGRIGDFDGLEDFVGIRVILLFQRDLVPLGVKIMELFQVYSHEDVGERLADQQFGYRAMHYIVGIPSQWLEVPSFARFKTQRCEVQVRTMAQHIWAAASHKLQYKHESSVPQPLRRSIHRVSALLETVDLEFERVLAERDSYLARPTQTASEELNVENLRKVLDERLPKANRIEREIYDDLLTNLRAFEVRTVGQLNALLDRRLPTALANEAEIVAGLFPDAEQDAERIARGVYFTHTGLLRVCMEKEFGRDAWIRYITTGKRKPI